jgi:dCTP deaminase
VGFAKYRRSGRSCVILTDREIKIHLDRGLITIDPRPDAIAYNSTSVDLTLDSTISEFKDQRGGIETAIDPVNANFKDEEILEDITQRKTLSEEGYLLKPQNFILGWTEEYIDLVYHTRLAARVEGKSSLARIGIAVHMTAPTIHSGFEGQIRLEIVNHGRFPIRLRPRMRICQLIFEQTLGTPEKGSPSQFSGQTSIG